MNIIDYIKSNKLLRKYNPGGTVIDVSKPMMSRDDFVAAERQKIIDAAYQKSLSRTMPTVPYVLSQTKESFDWYKKNELKYYQNLLQDKLHPTLLYRHKFVLMQFSQEE